MTRIKLHGLVKGYDGEKLSYCLAEKLRGAAFSVFLRMSADDQKDFDKLEKELLKEFKSEQRNREEAVNELGKRKRIPNESILTFSYSIEELVKFAYPTFAVAIQASIAKDYFVNGLDERMQIWLKATTDYSAKTLKEVTDLASSLEIAGVKPHIKSEIFKVTDEKSIVDEIADKVIEKLNFPASGSQADTLVTYSTRPLPRNNDSEVNYFRNNKFGGARPKNYRGYRRGKFGGDNRNTDQKSYKCRCCQSTDHMFRSCPTRCCQACGARGHDAWDKNCPNYQL